MHQPAALTNAEGVGTSNSEIVHCLLALDKHNLLNNTKGAIGLAHAVAGINPARTDAQAWSRLARGQL